VPTGFVYVPDDVKICTSATDDQFTVDAVATRACPSVPRANFDGVLSAVAVTRSPAASKIDSCRYCVCGSPVVRFARELWSTPDKVPAIVTVPAFVIRPSASTTIVPTIVPPPYEPATTAVDCSSVGPTLFAANVGFG
jgi:hypothetical protein